jgi:hypothetical protein
MFSALVGGAWWGGFRMAWPGPGGRMTRIIFRCFFLATPRRRTAQGAGNALFDGFWRVPSTWTGLKFKFRIGVAILLTVAWPSPAQADIFLDNFCPGPG